MTTAKLQMYRFGRHHGQSDEGTGRAGYTKIGPRSLTCMNCHQTHNAIDEVWRPLAWAGTGWHATPPRASPPSRPRATSSSSATPPAATTGAPGAEGYYSPGQQVKAIEGNAVRGDRPGRGAWRAATSARPTRPVRLQRERRDRRGTDLDRPGHPRARRGKLPHRRHGLLPLSLLQLQVRPVVLVRRLPQPQHRRLGDALRPRARLQGPHRAHPPRPVLRRLHRPRPVLQLPPQRPVAQDGAPTRSPGRSRGAPRVTGRDSCTQCHYGTKDYAIEMGNESVAGVPGAQPDLGLDFPHSGATTDIKLLGSYIDPGPATAASPRARSRAARRARFVTTTITETNLDAVCLRCHPGVGVHQ